jgi:hypothetical protein
VNNKVMEYLVLVGHVQVNVLAGLNRLFAGVERHYKSFKLYGIEYLVN